MRVSKIDCKFFAEFVAYSECQMSFHNGRKSDDSQKLVAEGGRGISLDDGRASCIKSIVLLDWISPVIDARS